MMYDKTGRRYKRHSWEQSMDKRELMREDVTQDLSGMTVDEMKKYYVSLGYAWSDLQRNDASPDEVREMIIKKLISREFDRDAFRSNMYRWTLAANA